MALPPLEGDIILRDNASETFNRIGQSADQFVSRLTAAEQKVGNLRSSLSGLGNVPTPHLGDSRPGSRGADAEREAQQRVIQASTGIGRLANLEEQLTAATQREASRREAMTSKETQNRRALLQNMLKGLTTQEIDAIIARLTDLGREAEQVRARIAKIDNAGGTGGNARVASTRAEVRERQQLIQRLSNIQAQEEKEITDATRLESNRRLELARDEARQRQQVSSSISGRVGGAIASVVTIAAVRQAEQLARSFAEGNTEIKRANLAFNELAGGVATAQGRLVAIQQGLGGTVSQLGAIKVANQAATLSLATTGREFGRLAQAARIVSIISPVITDAGSAITELGLASANLSFRRLDQLGLSVTEVKDRMKELQTANGDLSDSQAFLQASVDALIDKGGALTDSMAAQASGVERFNVAINEFLDQEGAFSNAIESVYGKLADNINEIFTATGVGSAKSASDFVTQRVAELQDAVKNTQQEDFIPVQFSDSANREALAGFEQLKTAIDAASNALIDGTPGALIYRDALVGIAQASAATGTVSGSQVDEIKRLGDEFERFQKLVQAGSGADISGAAQRQAEAAIANAEILVDRLRDISEAQNQLSAFDATGLDSFGDTLEKQLTSLRSALAQTGELPEGGAKQLEFLQGAADSTSEGLDFLADASERLGSAFASSSPQVQQLAQVVVTLSAGLRAGTIEQESYARGIEEVNRQLDQVAARQQVSFFVGFDETTEGLRQVSDLTAAGVQGIDQYGEALAKVRSEILASGGATKEQLQSISLLNAQVAAADAIQAKFAGTLGTLDSGFIGSSTSAQSLVREMINLAASINTGAINATQGKAAIAELTNELFRLSQAEPAQAIDDFVAASQQAIGTSGQLVDSISGLPVAFNAADLAGQNLSGTLQQLIADAQGLSSAAQSGAANLAQRLIPSLGIGGAISQAQEFQGQIQQATNAFLDANSQRAQAGQAPLDTSVLDFALGGLQQFQSAFVADATRATDGIAGAVSGIGDQINSALDGVISGLLSPTTGGLIPDDVLSGLLGREDALDENARRLADVAVNGFKSPWVDGLKDLEIIPQSVLDQGEEAVRRFAATQVKKHTDGLTTEFYNVDAAVQQVIEKLQGNQQRAAFLDQVREQVRAVAGEVDDLDLQEALGIDVSQQRGARASKSALAGLPTPEEIFAQFNTLLGGEGSPITNALTISPEQQGELQVNTTGAIEAAGEAMVTQAETGAYGQRSMDAIIASIEVKKADLEKSGRTAADWMGTALVTQFRDNVPPALLDILLLQLLPLLGEAQARTAERASGSAAQ